MNIFFRITSTAFALFLLLSTPSCSSNPHDVDIDDIEVNLDIRHFEDDLFNKKLNTYEEFKKKYPYFLDNYTMFILQWDAKNSEEGFDYLMRFRDDQRAQKVYGFVKEKYGDFEKYEKDLTKAYKYFKYHFKDEKIPSIVTYTSNFSLTMDPVGMDYIGIALDMHLGEDFVFYQNAISENYWKKILTPQTIVPMQMRAHANDLFEHTNKNKNFLDKMIYEGKILYFLDAVTPFVEDHTKIGLTEKELQFCQAEEKNIWSYIIQKKLLYETSALDINRFFIMGAITRADGVPENTPSMIGRYAGWMLVRNYMKNNPTVTLSELMNNPNSQEILDKSQYKP